MTNSDRLSKTNTSSEGQIYDPQHDIASHTHSAMPMDCRGKGGWMLMHEHRTIIITKKKKQMENMHIWLGDDKLGIPGYLH